MLGMAVMNICLIATLLHTRLRTVSVGVSGVSGVSEVSGVGGVELCRCALTALTLPAPCHCQDRLTLVSGSVGPVSGQCRLTLVSECRAVSGGVGIECRSVEPGLNPLCES